MKNDLDLVDEITRWATALTLVAFLLSISMVAGGLAYLALKDLFA